MPAYPQWWNSAKSAQLSAAMDSGTVAAGTTQTAPSSPCWLFNDKGSLLGASSMSGYKLIVEGSWDGETWFRSGEPALDDGWVEVQITGNTDNTGGAITAQAATAWTPLGTGRSLALTAIPQGCGREIAARIVLPLGASTAGLRLRIGVDSATASMSFESPATITGSPTATVTMVRSGQTAKARLFGYGNGTLSDLHLSANADNPDAWARDDTARVAWNAAMSSIADAFLIRRAAAGANPITWTTLLSLTATAMSIAESVGNVTAKGFTVSDGGTVTQATSITTGVTLNTTCGQITTVTAPAIAAGAEADFTLTNSVITNTGNIIVNVRQQFNDGHIIAAVKSIGSGSCVITLTNVGTAAVSAGTAIINFMVFGGSAT